MSDKNRKELRKAIRPVVEDMLPQVVTEQLTTAMYQQLAGELQAKLQVIEQSIHTALREMAERQKDVQSMLIREMMANQEFRAKASGETAEGSVTNE